MAEEAQIPDVALEMKEAANKLYSKKDFQGAASKYSVIIEQFSQTLSPAFLRVIRCNRAASLIELGLFIPISHELFHSHLVPSTKPPPFLGEARYQDAIPDLQDVIRVKATSREGRAVTQKAHFRLARCFCEIGKYREAIQEMEKYREIIGGQAKLEETSLYAKILSGLVPRDQIPDPSMPPPATQARNVPKPPATAMGSSLRQVRYEIKIFNIETPIVKYDMVPMTLCSPHPPEVQMKMFLANLVQKYHNEVLKSRAWICWNCPARAVGLVHSPASYLHLPDAQVIDFTQPVCVNGGLCDTAARAMMAEEMTAVMTAQAS